MENHQRNLDHLLSSALKMITGLGLSTEDSKTFIHQTLNQLVTDKLVEDLRGRFEQCSLNELQDVVMRLHALDDTPQQQNAKKAPSRARR